MPTTAMPLAFYTVITGAAECVREELDIETNPCCEGVESAFRFVAFSPGEIAWDNCECGSFTQSAGPTLYSDDGRTPISLFDRQNNCGPFYVGVDVTAIILRCAPGVDSNGNPPTAAQLDAAAQLWSTDSDAIRRGITCCLKNLLEEDEIEGYQIMSQTPVGPAGGCVGSQLVYRIWLLNCDC